MDWKQIHRFCILIPFMIPNFPQNPIKIRKLAINYSGWWFIEPTPLKNDGQNVSWDDYSIPN